MCFERDVARINGRPAPAQDCGDDCYGVALDKSTGEIVWQIELPAGTTGAPMTYMFGGKQYIVVAIGGIDTDPEFVALALP